MKIIRDLKNINFNTPIIASIGAFDGIHLGHQKIINKVVNKSKKENLKSAIITFYPFLKFIFQIKILKLFLFIKN
jgi:riboflavin kinase/FMN adenylyltransferase